MKKITLIICFILFLSPTGFCQVIDYDLFSISPPPGWEIVNEESSITWSKIDTQKRDWCQLILYKSLKSANDPETDFKTEWMNLVTLNYKGSGAPENRIVKKSAGWTIITGSTKWEFNKKQVTTQLTTYCGNGVRTSIVCNMTSPRFQKNIDESLKQLKIKIPASTITSSEKTASPVNTSETPFQYNTTNFDDGWTSSLKDNWVEVKKGPVLVKIHYPDSRADAYQSVLKSADLNAWNILVAPSYIGIKNFEWRSIQSFESISFMEADATDPISGQPRHIILFKKHYNNGNGRYLEFIADNKTRLETTFGPYHNTEFDWDNYANIQFRNKFAIASNDLLGTWSSSDYASLTYYYVNTGATASTTATSSSNLFTFLPGNKYKSEYAGASGQVGNMKFATQNFEGKSIVEEWKLTLTNRFKGETEIFDARFEAIKGGRILILTDRLGTVLSLVKKSRF